MSRLWHRLQDRLDPVGADRRWAERTRVAIARLAVASMRLGLASDHADQETRRLIAGYWAGRRGAEPR